MATGNFELSNWSTKIIHVRKTLVYIFIFCSCADLLEQIFHFVEHFKSDMFQLDMLDSNTHISLQGAFINRFKFMWCMRWPLDLSYYDEGHCPLRSGAFSTCSRSLLQVLKAPSTVGTNSFFDHHQYCVLQSAHRTAHIPKQTLPLKNNAECCSASSEWPTLN